MSWYEHLNACPVSTLYPPPSPEARRLFERCLVTEPHKWLEKARTGLGFDSEFLMIEYREGRLSFSVAGGVFCIMAAGSMELVPPLGENGDTLVAC